MPMLNPFRDMEEFRREIDRMFEDLFPSRRRWRVAFLPGHSARRYPLVNVHDDKDAVYVQALAPGLNTDTLHVTVVRDTVTISGEKLPASADVRPEAFHRSERAEGRFVRKIELPTEVDESKVSANYTNGLLLITLPKAEKAKPRQVTVNVER
jgi:HSP20 family protein